MYATAPSFYMDAGDWDLVSCDWTADVISTEPLLHPCLVTLTNFIWAERLKVTQQVRDWKWIPRTHMVEGELTPSGCSRTTTGAIAHTHVCASIAHNHVCASIAYTHVCTSIAHTHVCVHNTHSSVCIHSARSCVCVHNTHSHVCIYRACSRVCIHSARSCVSITHIHVCASIVHAHVCASIAHAHVCASITHIHVCASIAHTHVCASIVHTHVCVHKHKQTNKTCSSFVCQSSIFSWCTLFHSPNLLDYINSSVAGLFWLVWVW